MTRACEIADFKNGQVPPDADDDPWIDGHIGDVPVRVFYDAAGSCVLILRIEDAHGNDLPVRSLATHEVDRLRHECEREVYA